MFNPLSEISTSLTWQVAQPLQTKHEFLVNRGANHDLAGTDEILLSSFDSTPHRPGNMDYSIDPMQDLNLTLIFNELVDYIDRPMKTPSNFGFLMKIHLTTNDITFCPSHDPVSIHPIFSHTI